MNNIKIGLLDGGAREINNLKTEDIYPYIIQEAMIAEKYKFSRIWYTEHYINNNNCTWLSPELILPIISAYTSKIRVGIAGVCVLYKEPFMVASNFKLLNNLADDRIDLGFAKGSILTQYPNILFKDISLNQDEIREEIFKRINKTIEFLKNDTKKTHKEIIMPPLMGRMPEMWNLTSSPSGYLDALELGVNCSRSIFYESANLESGIQELTNYREAYFERYKKMPQINIVVTGTCQGTEKENKIILEKAIQNKDYHGLDNRFFGKPQKVFEELKKVASYYDVDEVIFLEASKNFKNRLNTIKNLGKMLDLKS